MNFLYLYLLAVENNVSQFVSQNSADGSVVIRPDFITKYLGSITVTAYGNWLSFALISVVVGLIIYVVFKYLK